MTEEEKILYNSTMNVLKGLIALINSLSNSALNSNRVRVIEGTLRNIDSVLEKYRFFILERHLLSNRTFLSIEDDKL